MNHRLQQLLAAENISQSQFADNIGVARASVSHILAGRNKPGFDFIESIARNYPDINLEWIITGKGKMYKSAAPAKPEKTVITDDLFSGFDEEQIAINASNNHNNNNLKETIITPVNGQNKPADTAATITSMQANVQSPKTPETKSKTSLNNTQIINNQRNILKIVIFYDDNTYQELK